ncbi:hypothetical protein R6Q59_016489 [Mikania micrantha]
MYWSYWSKWRQFEVHDDHPEWNWAEDKWMERLTRGDFKDQWVRISYSSKDKMEAAGNLGWAGYRRVAGYVMVSMQCPAEIIWDQVGRYKWKLKVTSQFCRWMLLVLIGWLVLPILLFTPSMCWVKLYGLGF